MNLSGWKEISSYLDVSPRTAQLWEKKYQLPVRRIGGSRGPVHISIDELEAWRQERVALADSTDSEAVDAAAAAPLNGDSRQGNRRYFLAALSAAAAGVVGWKLLPEEATEVRAPDRVIEIRDITTPPRWVSLSPDGQQVAMAAAVNGSAHPGLQVIDTTSGDLRTLVDSLASYDPVAWSPDGRRIAYGDRNGNLFTVPSTGGEAIRVAQLPGAFIRGMDWNRDGQAILASILSVGIVEVEIATGSVTPVLSHTHAESAQYVEPDARKAILFSSMVHAQPDTALSLPMRVSLLFRDDGAIEEMFTLAQTNPGVRLHPDGYAVHAAGSPEQMIVVATPITVAGRASAQTKTPILVSTSGDTSSVAEDGTVAVLRTDEMRFDLFWMNRTDTGIRRMARSRLYWGTKPRLSPNGRQAVVIGGDGIDSGYWLVGAEGKQLVTSHPTAFGSSAWSPDGKVLANGTARAVELVPIYKPADRRSITPKAPFIPSDWSEDGTTLLGSQLVEGRAQLWLLPVDGSGPGRATLRAPGDLWDGRWSPDERLMSYGQVLDGDRRVCVRRANAPADDPGVVVAQGRQPKWIKGGAELIYERDRVLYAVSIRLEGERIIADEPEQKRYRLPRRVDKRMYDVSPDGERILVSHPPSENPRPIAVEVWSKLKLP